MDFIEIIEYRTPAMMSYQERYPRLLHIQWGSRLPTNLSLPGQLLQACKFYLHQNTKLKSHAEDGTKINIDTKLKFLIWLSNIIFLKIVPEPGGP